MTNSIFIREKSKQPAVRKLLLLLWLLTAVIVHLTSCSTKNGHEPISLKGPVEVYQKNDLFSIQLPDGESLQSKLRIRGNSSLQYPKKSMRLKVSQPVSFCGLPAHKVWVLNAGYIDKSFIRHRLSFDLFRAMGAHNLAPQGCYEELEINGEYRGLYFVQQRIDRGRCGITRQQPGGVIFKEPPVFIQDEAGVEYNGNRFGQKYPSEEKKDYSELARSLQDFLFQSNDSLFDAQIAQTFHLENVADWMLLLLFTNSTDGLLRNFYLYRLHEGLPFRIAIWDYDETFGRYGDNRLNNIETELDWKRNPLLKRLCERPHFRELLKERWALHRGSSFREAAIYERIDEYVLQLEPIVEKNFERWPADGPGYVDDSGFREEVGLIRNFTSIRLQTLDKRLANW